jgi:F-type H+-transporting ATPase subunit epsilon
LAIPQKLLLEIVTPEGLLLREEVDEVIAPGELGYFGVRPGHTPFLATLGIGSIMYRKGEAKRYLTSFWGFCEVLPDRVNILAEVGERAEGIDAERAEKAKEQAEQRMKTIRGEADYRAAQAEYTKAVVRLGLARRLRDQ